MRIITKQELLEYPEYTVFSKYCDYYFEGLYIKYDNCTFSNSR